ncbi:MAG: hypothetical protein J7500_15995 [Sphingomonas sp.]|uniref:hypothetical protein n=1 Tax=Sphingomonas sp. TaxID=28214 RepID=UPI001B170B69|nr:hypothetical protein [Sphingomonas sp.]MBO9624211.1 hypothetical protein [Sphingomonas sp.]
MQWYRFYCVVQDKIVSGEDLKAEDDSAAIAAVRERITGHDCELWKGAQRIAAIPADGGEPMRF